MKSTKKIVVQNTLTKLPMSENQLDVEFLNITASDLDEIIDENIAETPRLASDARKNSFKNVLLELDKLKDKLGGSPTFGGQTPAMDVKEAHQTLFGVPMPAVKDWFRMTLRNEWAPQFFWVKLASLFGVTKNGMSQYEEIHISIQRLGVLIDNKDRFIHILESKDEARYDELSKITGLAWHPKRNGTGTEKIYIEFTEKFLTDYFEVAKSKGEDALIDYFYAFQGVCFEDRARNLKEYALHHPLAGDGQEDVTAIADWSRNDRVEDVFMKETTLLAIKNTKAPTPSELLEHLQSKGIFDMEFMTNQDTKSKPTEEEFKDWAQKQVAQCILSEEEDSVLSAAHS